MNLFERQRCELIDRVVHEGDPEFLFAPMESPPPGLPRAWNEILTAKEPRTAVLRLWEPMRLRLPFVTRALQERLQGVALLRTEDVPASLIYFFQDGPELFPYRGFLPLQDPSLPLFTAYPELKEFYAIHDGWTSFFTDDDGPVRSLAWGLLMESPWPETQWKFPPGAFSLENLSTIYFDEDEVAFALDSSKPNGVVLRCQIDGKVDSAADLWTAIDDEVGTFLLELDPTTSPSQGESAKNGTEGTARYLDRLLDRVSARWSAVSRLGGAFYQRQWCQMFLDRAALETAGSDKTDSARRFQQEALAHWCASLELGGVSDPLEVMGFFGLAHTLSDKKALGFIASMPLELWAEDSLESIQTQLLLCLYSRDSENASFLAEEAAGLLATLQPPDPAATATAECLESLRRRDSSMFARSRKQLLDLTGKAPPVFPPGLSPAYRAMAMDAVAAVLAG